MPLRRRLSVAGGSTPASLGHRLLIGGRGPTVVQYWRTVEDVYRYASSPDYEHRPAWAALNARARKATGSVGIWPETFAVPAGGHESISVSMPPTGLAAATGVVPVASGGESAQERIASRHQSAFWVACLQEVWGVWARRRISVSLLAPATTVAACRRPG